MGLKSLALIYRKYTSKKHLIKKKNKKKQRKNGTNKLIDLGVYYGKNTEQSLLLAIFNQLKEVTAEIKEIKKKIKRLQKNWKPQNIIITKLNYILSQKFNKKAQRVTLGQKNKKDV